MKMQRTKKMTETLVLSLDAEETAEAVAAWVKSKYNLDAGWNGQVEFDATHLSGCTIVLTQSQELPSES